MPNNMMQWNQLLSTMRPGAKAPESFAQDESRNPFERDYDRVIFSFDFRRMQGKTQVLPFAESDFVHDRLTHSLETSSIGRSLGKLVGNRLEQKDNNIKSNDIATIVSTACLAHDIGNPPFGHNGEKAIKSFFNFDPNHIFFKKENSEAYELDDQQIKDLKSFDGNPQGLRLLVNRQRGLGLTYATLGSFVKYPWESQIVDNKNIKKYGIFQSEKEIFINIANVLGLIRKSDSLLIFCRHPLSFLVEAADDIAYRIIDLEDSIILNFVYFHENVRDVIGNDKLTELSNRNKISRLGDFMNVTVEDVLKRIAGSSFAEIEYNKCKGEKSRYAYLRAKSMGNLIRQVGDEFFNNYESIMKGDYSESLLKTIKYNDEMTILKEIAIEREYQNRAARQIELSGHEVLGKLLKVLLDAYIFPNENDSYKLIVNGLFPITETGRYNIIMEVIDFISGMTDPYALSLFQKTHGIRLPQVY
jgi:dGTPase